MNGYFYLLGLAVGVFGMLAISESSKTDYQTCLSTITNNFTTIPTHEQIDACSVVVKEK